MKRILTATAAVALLVMALAPSAKAQPEPIGGQASQLAVLHVSAVVVTSCVMSTRPINFGNLDIPTLALNAAYAHGEVVISCANGASEGSTGVTFDGGTAASAAAGYQMSDGLSYLPYSLCSDPVCVTQIAPYTAYPVALGSTSAANPFIFNVYGMIPAGTVPSEAGLYTDAINVTLE